MFTTFGKKSTKLEERRGWIIVMPTSRGVDSNT